MNSKSYLLIGSGIGLFMVFFLGALSWIKPYDYYGSVIDPAKPAFDFQLIDQFGNTLRLSDLKGQVVVMFFGYTYCPDVCPVTLTEMKRLSKSLESEKSNIKFLFITVDPDRDAPELLKEYLEYFDESFIGLTGSVVELERVWRNFGVYRQKGESVTLGGYIVEHSSRIYVVDKIGNLKITYPYRFETEEILRDLRNLLKDDS